MPIADLRAYHDGRRRAAIRERERFVAAHGGAVPNGIDLRIDWHAAAVELIDELARLTVESRQVAAALESLRSQLYPGEHDR